MDENKKPELTELDVEMLAAVAGGNVPNVPAPDVSEAEVESNLKNWVRMFKAKGLTRQEAENFISGAIRKREVYWWLAKDPYYYKDLFMQLWDTYGTW